MFDVVRFSSFCYHTTVSGSLNLKEITWLGIATFEQRPVALWTPISKRSDRQTTVKRTFSFSWRSRWARRNTMRSRNGERAMKLSCKWPSKKAKSLRPSPKLVASINFFGGNLWILSKKNNISFLSSLFIRSTWYHRYKHHSFFSASEGDEQRSTVRIWHRENPIIGDVGRSAVAGRIRPVGANIHHSDRIKACAGCRIERPVGHAASGATTWSICASASAVRSVESRTKSSCFQLVSLHTIKINSVIKPRKTFYPICCMSPTVITCVIWLSNSWFWSTAEDCCPTVAVGADPQQRCTRSWGWTPRWGWRRVWPSEHALEEPNRSCKHEQHFVRSSRRFVFQTSGIIMSYFVEKINLSEHSW